MFTEINKFKILWTIYRYIPYILQIVFFGVKINEVVSFSLDYSYTKHVVIHPTLALLVDNILQWYT